jgi:nanoRNase/pAp phosphatase (c-di-AMP/oligoRNAs hydrolase)
LSGEEKKEKFPFTDPTRLKKAAVVCHRNADVDAYLSAYGIAALLEAASPGCSVDIVTPDGMTSLTTRLSKKFSHRVTEEADEDYDLYVAVDVGDTELLKEWLEKMKNSKGVKVLIDHHPLKDGLLYDRAIVDEKATSAGEVVYRLFKELKVELEATTAQALLEALLFDSSHLAIAGEEGLRAAVGLIEAGADLSEARRDLRSEPDYGEVLAKLKGAQRLKIYKAGDWILATSRVGSFQAHVARSLILLGADVAVVGGETDEETRASLRSTQRFYDVTKIHLGTQVAGELGKALGGHGGGHPTASSFSCTAAEDEVLAKTLAALARLLGAELIEVE